MLKIWGRRNSLNVQKVLWLAEELALQYEHIPAGGSFGGLDTPEFLAMNPHGRIPIIVDESLVIWESHAILRYLAAYYGKKQFWPEDAVLRSQIDSWMDWAQATLQPDFMGVFWGFYRTPESQRNWTAIKESIDRCHQHFLLLNRILKHQPFLAGNSFTF